MYQLCVYFNIFLVFLQVYSCNIIEPSNSNYIETANRSIYATIRRPCKIKLDRDGYPMVYHENGKYLQPDSGPKNSLTINVQYGDNVYVSCGSRNLVYENYIQNLSTMQLTCNSDSSISGFLGALVECENIKDREEILRMENSDGLSKTCFGNDENYVWLEIGFPVNSKIFASYVKICFNQYTDKTAYSNYSLKKGTVFSNNFNNIKFLSKYFDIKTDQIQELYDNQQTIINGMLKLPLTDDKYVDMKDRKLVPGQFAPHESFMYNYKKRGTFYYENTNFQWKSINEGNWKEIQQNEHRCVDDKKPSPFEMLKVYTGSFGVAKLPDQSNVMVELRMKHDKFPVPAVFWKVYYTEDLTEGIAVLTLNNPYVDNVKVGEDQLKCEETNRVENDKVPECLRFDDQHSFTDIPKGITIFCEITEELQESIPYLPRYKKVGLLTTPLTTTSTPLTTTSTPLTTSVP